ncbi:MAG: hypothetical protein ABIO49_09130 [Dokdonella sp.]
MDPAAVAETTEPQAEPDGFAAARAAMDQAVRVVEAAFALLRAELRLARSSAFMLIWLGFALVFLGVGAWLATSAAIAAGIYQLTGNIFYGVGTVALANLVGVGIVLLAMRTCWRDLALPRTRRALLRIGRVNQ